MNEVNIKRSRLLEIVRENEVRYLAAQAAAVESYWEAADKEITKLRLIFSEKKEPLPKIHLAFPTDHSEDYDSAIRMLELSCDETISLTQPDFDALVRNKWSWHGHFKNVVSSYAVGPKAAIDKF